jgi:hypothetical protein
MTDSKNKTSQKTGSTPANVSIEGNKHQKLLLVEIESKITMISSRQKDLTREITDTKDIMRKYRERTLLPSQSSSDNILNRSETLYCLNMANFFQSIPFDKVYSFL